MSSNPTWGVIATIKASDSDILNFAAWHLELGARRVFIYLDEDAPLARDALKSHPKCRVILTDTQYWKRRRKHKGRPGGHQYRQTLNATHCYDRNPKVDWLLHSDVDEFLWPQTRFNEQLAALPPESLSARVRPIEVLAPDPATALPDHQHWAKSCARLLNRRRADTAKIYPNYGAHLNGGFLSHVAGKVFVRTGQPDITVRIHNAFQNAEMDANPPELTDTKLIHMHAPDWDHWHAHFRYRLEHGSYREGLKPSAQPNGAGMNMHAFLSMLEAENGEAGLRAFFRDVCTATPDLCQRLEMHGLLHKVTLNLPACRARHFPNVILP